MVGFNYDKDIIMGNDVFDYNMANGVINISMSRAIIISYTSLTNINVFLLFFISCEIQGTINIIFICSWFFIPL